MLTARMKFEKLDDVRYISHLDFQRTFQRALRRGEIDVAYSQGFNPHPKISFAMAMAVGMTSEGEYVDVELNKWISPDELTATLNQSLPKGLKILQCKISDQSHPSLMSIIRKGIYKVRITANETILKSEVIERVRSFMNQPEIIVEKTNKRGKKVQKDIKPLIDYINVVDVEEHFISFEMMLATGSQNNVKPETVFEKLAIFGESPLQYDTIRVHRINLLTQKDEQLISPMDIFIE